MAIKLTLEVKLDPEVGGPSDAMQQVIRRLNEIVSLPVDGFKFVFLAADETGAERIEEAFDEVLEDRAYRVIATVDRKYDKRDLRRRKLDAPTPMERELGEDLRGRGGRASGAVEAFSETIGSFADRHGVDRVEFSAGGRTVTLTPETRRNAQRALERIGMGPDEDEDGEGGE